MPQSLSQIYIHLVFSTKQRLPYISDENLPPLHAYMTGISKNLNSPVVQIGGVADHVHVLTHFPRDRTIAKWVECVKSNSSTWFKQNAQHPDAKQFSWQTGYGAFSVSPSQVPALKRYIQQQHEHHKTITFQEEYRRFLRKYDITYDERYLWD